MLYSARSAKEHAACAQQHQAAVVHLDRHYDVLAEVLFFDPIRLPG
jgi:hypothetical protein